MNHPKGKMLYIYYWKAAADTTVSRQDDAGHMGEPFLFIWKQEEHRDRKCHHYHVVVPQERILRTLCRH